MSIPLYKLKSYCKLSDLSCQNKSKEDIIKIVKTNLKKYKFAPRYLKDLNKTDLFIKKFEIRYNKLLERNGNKNKSKKSDYKPSKLDAKYKSKKISKYTKKWNSIYKTKNIKEKSSISGVPLSILKQVYNRGLAAWRGSSHRPGATQQQWGVARVNSFLTCGKTWEFPDHLLAKKSLKKSKVRNFWKKCDKKKLGKKTKSR